MIVRHDNFGDVDVGLKLEPQTIATGNVASIAISGGRAWCWGTPSWMELGAGLPANIASPTLIPDFIRLKAVSCAAGPVNSAVVVGSNKMAYAAGSNTVGQCGVGGAAVSNLAKFTQCVMDSGAALSGVQKMGFMDTNGFALLADGSMYWSGMASTVSAGSGTSTSFVKLDASAWGGLKVVDMAVGADHLVFLLNDGTVWGLGSNTERQLTDIAGTSGVSRVVKLNWATPQKAVRVFAGYRGTGAITEDGALWVCGGNTGGRWGLGDTNMRPQLTRTSPADAKVRTVSINGTWCHVALEDGTGWYAGDSSLGQSGRGLLYNSSNWAAVSTLVDSVELATQNALYNSAGGFTISRNSKDELYVAGLGTLYFTDLNTTSHKTNFTNLLVFPRPKVRPPDPNLYPKGDDFMSYEKFLNDLTAATPGLAEWDGTLKITSKPFGLDWPAGSNITCGTLINEEEILLLLDFRNTTPGLPRTGELAYSLNLATGAYTLLYAGGAVASGERIFEGLYRTSKDSTFGLSGMNKVYTAGAQYFAGHNFRFKDAPVAPVVRLVGNSASNAVGALLGEDLQYPPSPGIVTGKDTLLFHGGSNGAIVSWNTNNFAAETLTSGNTPFRSEVAIRNRSNEWQAFVGYDSPNMLCYSGTEKLAKAVSYPELARYRATGSIDYCATDMDYHLLAPASKASGDSWLCSVAAWGSYKAVSRSTPGRFMGAKTVGNGIGVMLPHGNASAGVALANFKQALSVRHNGTNEVQMFKHNEASGFTTYNNSTPLSKHKGIIYRGNKLHWFTHQQFHTAELVGVKPPPIEYQMHPYLNHS